MMTTKDLNSILDKLDKEMIALENTATEASFAMTKLIIHYELTEDLESRFNVVKETLDSLDTMEANKLLANDERLNEKFIRVKSELTELQTTLGFYGVTKD